MRRLTFLCHAATKSQREGRFPFPHEPILPGAQLRKPDLAGQILHGPETRTEETARLLASGVQSLDVLRDCDFGTWKGRALDEIGQSDPKGTASWLTHPEARPHGGEAFADVLERIGEWLDGFPQTGHVLAVTHAAVMRAAALHILGAPFAAFWRLDVQPLSVMELWSHGRAWTIRSLNAKPDSLEPGQMSTSTTTGT